MLLRSHRLTHLAGFLAAFLVLCVPRCGTAGEPPDPFFARVVEQARELAGWSYAPLNFELPAPLAALDYDDYRDIRFRPGRALWRGLRLFEVQFFHLGYLFREPVRLHVVENGAVQPLIREQGMFDYGESGLAGAVFDSLIDFAGFRLHFPLNRTDYKDEVMTFLGASYFRLLGAGQVYGASARGLAIDTALPKGEEFPAFREFWLVRPGPDAVSITIYALLDSPSATGAYRFRVTPGIETVTDIKTTLFARRDIERLGIAPLTSMYLYGENQARRFDDYRPEVHDSDGLLVQTGADEWIWRPLANPGALRVTALLDEHPRGFGLLQRDREFAHYLDLESRFERRPSLWIEPRGESWGKGAVHLVEIPSAEEIHDNIVAFWVPEEPMKARESRTFEYRLRAALDVALARGALGTVARTHVGWGAVPGAKAKPARTLRRFVVDFAGAELAALSADQPVAAELVHSTGQVSDLTVQKLPGSGGWRASFRLAPEGAEPADLRLHLALRGRRLTETWNYVWSPDALPQP